MTLLPTITNRLIAPAILLLLFSACAPLYPERQIIVPPQPTITLPTPVPQPTPTPVEPPAPLPADPVIGPAGSLYAEAESKLQTGDYTAAEMLLERALRIEPRNPHYWYTLARTTYHQGNFRQTVQFCLKADSLVAKNTQLAARNRELLKQAQSALQSP